MKNPLDLKSQTWDQLDELRKDKTPLTLNFLSTEKRIALLAQMQCPRDTTQTIIKHTSCIWFFYAILFRTPVVTSPQRLRTTPLTRFHSLSTYTEKIIERIE